MSMCELTAGYSADARLVRRSLAVAKQHMGSKGAGRVWADGDHLCLTTDDGRTRLTQTIGHIQSLEDDSVPKSDPTVSGCLGLELFRSELPSRGCGHFILCDGRLEFVHSGGVWSIELSDPGGRELSTVSWGESSLSFVSPREVERMLEFVSGFRGASDPTCRWEMVGVLFEAFEGRYHLVATDARRMGVATLNDSVPSEWEDVSLIIPFSAIRLLKELRIDNLALQFAGGSESSVRIYSRSWSIEFKPSGLRFPRWRSAVQGDAERICEVPMAVAEALWSSHVFSGEEVRAGLLVVKATGRGECSVTSESEGVEVRSKCQADVDRESSVRCNPVFMRDAIKSLAHFGDKVELWSGDAESPIELRLPGVDSVRVVVCRSVEVER